MPGRLTTLLKNCLRKKQPVEYPEDIEEVEDMLEEEPPLENVASVSFNINIDNEVTVDIDWAEETDSICSDLSILLRAITTGRLNDTIVETLRDCGLDNPDSKPFLIKLLQGWKSSIVEPLVSPLKVFRASRFWE